MISIELNNIKDFMNKLLKDNTFDKFLVHTIELTTKYTVTFDGFAHYDSGERDIYSTDYVPFEMIRGDIFSILKKGSTPKSFKINFLLSSEGTENIIERISGQKTHHDISGFNLNIVFEDHCLKLVTATNYKSFTLDKSFEKYFDDSIIKFLNKNEIN